MDIRKIRTTNWQMSTTGFGEVAEGANDIAQCLTILLTTQKGSDPIRPDFGIALMDWIDKPANVAAPGLVKEIIEQVGQYETRIDLTGVDYKIDEQKVIFGLHWQYKAGILYKNVSAADEQYKTYFLLADANGMVLFTGYDVSLIVK